MYAENMSRYMKTKFGFVSIAGNAFRDISYNVPDVME